MSYFHKKRLIVFFLIIFEVISCFAFLDKDFVLLINKDKRMLGLTGAPYASFSSESGLGVGLQIILFDALPDSVLNNPFDLKLDISMTTKNEKKIEFDFAQKFANYNFNAHLEYKKKPNNFYGIGGNTLSENKESYTCEKFENKVSIIRPIFDRFEIGPIIEFNFYNLSDKIQNGQLLINSIPGSEDNHKTIGVGILCEYKKLDHPKNPTNGYRLILENTHFNKSYGSDYRFFKSSTDFRIYKKIWYESVLCAQFNYLFTSSHSPFQQYPEQGGSTMMRGYKTGRFLDKQMLAGQLEYRSPFIHRIGSVLFISSGNSFDLFRHIRQKNTHYAGGIGCRFLVSQAKMLIIRGDLGFSKEGREIYFKVGQAF